ncbi:CDP-glycerol glycerophosphotransferase family protein [Vagococcus hydrophili]|uniref:Glycosyltransferase n=1 Tax=Vagococcus hydrophili TaxID=2714947 RepID=A0A6G8AR14_9ENTE|nr:CDP-glycerol glycerophosphotransferase family protein [Vagococcus hydrophili]QIL47436.1 glycosyltransferase [Vagococcus hydrophili]
MGVANKIARLIGPAVLPKISYYRKTVDSYTKYFVSEKVEKKTVLYESRDGKSLTDSPFAIFEYLLSVDPEQEYTHIWSVTESSEMEKVRELYKSKKNVIFVIRNSDEYLKWLTKAEFLINNSTFQPFVTIKDEQTYINTWHGTPLKTMGFDIPGNPANAKNVVRNFFMADYLISPNPHTTEMFVKNYRLNENYTGQIIESGYPRIDQTFHENKDDLLKMLFDFNVSLDLGKKIILYTPTFKGADLSVSDGEIAQIHQEMSLVRERFGEEYNVLVKVHPFIYDQAKKYVPLREFLIPDIIDTNKLLGIVDCLITDYSSIFFDYLVTDKPILFYCWDDDLYSNKRGKYFEYDELPGPVAFNIDELITKLEHLDEQQEIYKANYKLCKEKFVPYDDGQVTARVVEIIFNKETLLGVKVIQPTSCKKRLLIYPGGMRSNGITSSFLSLVQSINYEEYDVVCLLDNIRALDQIKNVADIPKNVSLLFRFDISNFTAKEYYQDMHIHLKGVKKGKEDKYPNEIYERDVRRLLGKQRFDVAIDFSGYSLHWGKIILASKADRHVCYLHSDMMLDMEREVNGRKIHKINLQGVFSVYNRYDGLVSVSEVMKEINQEKLAQYADRSKFTYADNTINPKKILEGTKEEKIIEVKDTEFFFRDGHINNLEKTIKLRSSRPDMVLGNVDKKELRDPHVDVLGKFEYNEILYYKISQNHQYLGWVEASGVEVDSVKILSKNKVSYFGKLNTSAADYFYTEPLGLAESYPLSKAGLYRNIYVSITDEVVTQTGISVRVMLKGNDLGWLPKGKITFSKKLNWTKTKEPSFKVKLLRAFALSANHLEKRYQMKRLKDTPLKKEWLAAYYENKNKTSLKGYLLPIENENYKELGVFQSIYVQSLATTLNGRWYEIMDDSGKTYFVKEEAISIKSFSEETVMTEKEVFKTATFKKIETVVFSTLLEAIDKKGTVVTSLDSVTVTKEIKTSENNIFYEVKWEDKFLFVEQASLNIMRGEGILNAKDEIIPYPDQDKVNIVTVGRLSQEKNQIVLIEAFVEFQKNQPNSHLYIIGAGPEGNNLQNKIQELGMSDYIELLGQVYNPFEFIKRCDIFALTSLYEGQSLVLIEALTLGMKCVSTDIPACRLVLKDGAYGLISETNDAYGVAQSLTEMINKEQRFETFDPYAYNQEAIKMFYQTLTSLK